MKKKCFIIFCLFLTHQSFAQGTIDVARFEKEITAKANTLCKYIVAVGTSIGQPGSVGNSEKDIIIKNKVPTLFWQ